MTSTTGSAGEGQYGYDAFGNQTSGMTGSGHLRQVRYTSAQQAYELTLGNQSSPLARTRFWYGPNGARYKRVREAGHP